MCVMSDIEQALSLAKSHADAACLLVLASAVRLVHLLYGVYVT